MYTVTIHGADSCNACIRTQNRLTRAHIPFEYDNLEVSLNNSYATIPVTEVKDLNGEVVYNFTGVPSNFNISIIKQYLEINQQLS